MVRLLVKILLTVAALAAALPQSRQFRSRPSSSFPYSSLTQLSAVEAAAATAVTSIDWPGILSTASARAFSGGTAGATAAAVQVTSLMWLRTAVNYQYRNGGDTATALRTLWTDGGLPRLYAGLPFALVQGPAARFGDTAANALALSIFDALDPVTAAAVPMALRTATGSVLAGIWRVILMPIDTVKTRLQVDGAEAGRAAIVETFATQGPAALYNGAIAASAATFVGHFPWFFTYNFLSEHLPTALQAATVLGTVPAGAVLGQPIEMPVLPVEALNLLRSAFIGLCATSTSDICSNSLRVLKTSKQTAVDPTTTYASIARDIVAAEGLSGLLGRGLSTRLIANIVQGVLFSVLFKYFQHAQK